MKQYPRNFKFKRIFRIKKIGKRFTVNYEKIQCGEYGIQALKEGVLNYKQLYAGYKVLKKEFKKKINIKINAACIISLTKKKTEARMGKGKGKRYTWVCPINKGMIIYEVFWEKNKDKILKKSIISHMKYYLNLINNKLPVPCKITKIKY